MKTRDAASPRSSAKAGERRNSDMAGKRQRPDDARLLATLAEIRELELPPPAPPTEP
jgi:hypothetical protein